MKPVSPEDSQFALDLDAKAKKGAEIMAWNEVLGPPDARHHNPGDKVEEVLYLERFGDFMAEAEGHDLRQADFFSKRDELKKASSKAAIEQDLVNLHEEADDEIQGNQLNMRARSEKSIWKKEHSASEWTKRLIRRLTFGLGFKAAKYYKPAKRYIKLQEKIYRKQDKIDSINADLHFMRENLKEYDEELRAATTEAEEKAVNVDIQDQQEQVRQSIRTRTAVLKGVNKQEQSMNEITAVVKSELDKEKVVIKEKWGARIHKRMMVRQALIDELAKHRYTQEDGLTAMNELKQRIGEIEIELEGLKQKIIKYKSGRPIFAFEQMFGTRSVPLLKKYEQHNATVDKTEFNPHVLDEERKTAEQFSNDVRRLKNEVMKLTDLAQIDNKISNMKYVEDAIKNFDFDFGDDLEVKKHLTAVREAINDAERRRQSLPLPLPIPPTLHPHLYPIRKM